MFIIFHSKLINYLQIFGANQWGEVYIGGIHNMTLYEYSSVHFSYVCDIISGVYVDSTLSDRVNKRWLCFVHICGFHFVISTDNWNKTFLNWKEKRLKKTFLVCGFYFMVQI